MKYSFQAFATVLAVLATAALAQQNQQTASQQEDKTHEQHFIQMASSGNNFEVQLGQLVQQKAQDQRIKEFAQRLVQDHQKAEQQLRQIAQQMGVSLTDQLSPVHQAMLQEFQKKDGQALERAFAFDQVGDHHKDILKYQWQAEHAQDAQLKQYAQQQIPTLREHLQLAEQCAEQFVPEARTASGTIRGESSTGSTGTSSGTSGTSGTGRTR